MTKDQNKYVFAVGRRKAAVARTRLFEGKGETLVNGRPIGEYFPGVKDYLLPFTLTDSIGRFFATVKVAGGGKTGQLKAVVHSLAKALTAADPKDRPILRRGGFLTTDSRVKERRKFGLAGKARKEKQSPKR